MSGQPVLDWPAVALSLFNAFLLLWLGFTILLESDRRSPGIWLAADGLFLGAAFFIAHSAILENGIHYDLPRHQFLVAGRLVAGHSFALRLVQCHPVVCRLLG